jgi:hypothetical protein
MPFTQTATIRFTSPPTLSVGVLELAPGGLPWHALVGDAAMLRIVCSPFVVTSPVLRQLSQAEEDVLHAALRKSLRIVSKGRAVGV